MKITVFNKGLKDLAIDGLKIHLEESMESVILKRLSESKIGETHVHAVFEKNPHKNMFIVSLTLYTPKKVFFTRKTNVNAEIALNKCINGLEHQVDKWKTSRISKKRGEQEYESKTSKNE